MHHVLEPAAGHGQGRGHHRDRQPAPARAARGAAARAADPDEAVVDLKVAFLGALDIPGAMLSFDASIYDSFIGYDDFKLSLEGDIAIRVCWGAEPDFVVSVGGFHPTYTPRRTSTCRRMRRMTLSLLKDNPRITLKLVLRGHGEHASSSARSWSCTSASAASRSRASWASTSSSRSCRSTSTRRCTATSPSRPATSTCSRSRSTSPCRGRHRGSRTAPARSRSSSSASRCRSRCGWATRRRQRCRRWPCSTRFCRRCRTTRRGRRSSAPGANQLVQLAPAPAGTLVVDAAGLLTVSQRVLPLGTDFTLFGTATPSDVSRVSVSALRIGEDAATGTAAAADTRDVTEAFAPAAFNKLSDADKLTAPAFEQRAAGVQSVAGTNLTTDAIVGLQVAYETIELDSTAASEPARGTGGPGQTVFEALARGGVIGSSSAAKSSARAAQRQSVLDVGPAVDRYAVAHVGDLRPLDENGAVAAVLRQGRLALGHRRGAAPRRAHRRRCRAPTCRSSRRPSLPPEYTFVPWLRRGIAAEISAGRHARRRRGRRPAGPRDDARRADARDRPGRGARLQPRRPSSATSRSSAQSTSPASRATPIMRTHPADGAPHATPGELAYVEFYDEDFPWRYTPARASILEAQALDRAARPHRGRVHRPNAHVRAAGADADAAGGPAAADGDVGLGARAADRHSSRMPSEVGDQIVKDPDNALSRILCPRRLLADSATTPSSFRRSRPDASPVSDATPRRRRRSVPPGERPPTQATATCRSTSASRSRRATRATSRRSPASSRRQRRGRSSASVRSTSPIRASA